MKYLRGQSNRGSHYYCRQARRYSTSQASYSTPYSEAQPINPSQASYSRPYSEAQPINPSQASYSRPYSESEAYYSY